MAVKPPTGPIDRRPFPPPPPPENEYADVTIRFGFGASAECIAALRRIDRRRRRRRYRVLRLAGRPFFLWWLQRRQWEGTYRIDDPRLWARCPRSQNT